jgi:hypothetical protein
MALRVLEASHSPAGEHNERCWGMRELASRSALRDAPKREEKGSRLEVRLPLVHSGL